MAVLLRIGSLLPQRCCTAVPFLSIRLSNDLELLQMLKSELCSLYSLASSRVSTFSGFLVDLSAVTVLVKRSGASTYTGACLSARLQFLKHFLKKDLLSSVLINLCVSVCVSLLHYVLLRSVTQSLTF